MEGEAATTGGKRSAWMTHVKKTMKANKGKPLSAVLKMAKKTYKKSGGGVAETASPLSGGRRRTRKSKSRRGGRKH
jgi:hypothetical protein